MRKKFIYAATVSMMAMSSVSYAQESETSSATAQDDFAIVVTAQRREQSLQDVPISVTVATGDSLVKSNINSLEGLSLRTPSVRIAQAPASDQLHIRGTGSGFNPGFEQSVATFVDGVYRGRARSSRAALFDVERVEILKGPQTTYFGNNAIAGAFNIATRKPGSDLSYNGMLLYSPTDDEYIVEGGLSAPLTDTLAVRVAGRLSGMNGYIDNTHTGDKGPHMRDFIGRAAMHFEPSDTWKSDLRIDYGRYRDTSTLSAEVTHCPPDAAFGGPRGQCARYVGEFGAAVDTTLDYSSTAGPSLFHYDMLEVAFSNSVMVGDHELSFITSYFNHDLLVTTDVVPLPYGGFFGTSALSALTQTEDYDQFTQEIRVSSPVGETIEYMAGAYFLRGTLNMNHNTGYWFAPFSNLPPAAAAGFPANSPVAQLISNKQRETTLSAFGAITWNVDDALRLVLGLRYSHVRKKASRTALIGVSGDPFFKDFVPVGAAPTNAINSIIGLSSDPFPISERKDDKFMPSVVVQYDLASNVMVYASYTNGFKAGGYSFTTADVFGPESVDAYEIGIKGSAFDRALNFNLALFLSNYSNLQEATQVLVVNDPADPTDDAFRAIVGNSAKSRAKGVELGLQWRASDNISFHSDIAYLDSKYLDYPGAPCRLLDALTIPNCSSNMGGVRRTFSPKWSGSAGVDVTMPFGGDIEFKFSPSMYFSSRYNQQTANGDPLLSQPSYAKFDLRAAVGDAGGRWEFAVLGKNLTNRTTASYRQVIPTAAGSVQTLPDRERSVAFQLTIRN